MENKQNNEKDFFDKHSKLTCCVGFFACWIVMGVLGYFIYWLIKSLVA